ncbi:protein involved in gliding motility GldH [Winogradskyella wandonensis]|uniref:Protein involved in gliding motility GldH n=1 Tax=Winogradskyella wandonensis TaxID=1442586 RepID=A0A4R1KRS0_9FLAO|nr:gliding motility lipoprotein GldH [Winogradskyella wandonensis]TCK67746.1 protein involved in gliding motility GldH [Winogradskyella wandonensis]
MPRKTSLFLVQFLLLVLVLSCDSKLVFDQYQSLPNQWNKDEIISFKIKAPDTTNNYNLFVNIRNNKDYKYNNLFLITALEYPNGKTFIDTLEYKMAAPDGTLLGEGFTDVKENKLWYKGHKDAFRFKEEGVYTFSVQQAMRKYGEVSGIDNLQGITEVGFRVENK